MGDFHSTLLPSLSLRGGKWIFQNVERVGTKAVSLTRSRFQEETSISNVSSNRIKSKRPRKYGFIDLLLFSLFFYANCEYHHFFKLLPSSFDANERWCELMAIADYLGNCFAARTAISIHFLWIHPHIDPKTRKFYVSLKEHIVMDLAEINFSTLYIYIIYEKIIFRASTNTTKCSFNTRLIIILLTLDFYSTVCLDRIKSIDVETWITNYLYYLYLR